MLILAVAMLLAAGLALAVPVNKVPPGSAPALTLTPTPGAAPAIGAAPPRAGPGANPGAHPGAVSAAERACLDDLKLLYPGDGRCYQLLSTGPCKPHEWLVLDARTPDRLRPVCARVPCGEREVLWPKDGRCYQRFRDRETLCPHPGNLLVSNPFGLGECACMRTQPHARDPTARPGGAGGAAAACYPLYHRGPCADGQVLVPRANGTADQGVCVRDPCHQDQALHAQQQQEQQEQQPVMPLVLWPTSAGGDGRCHPLGSTDVALCPEQSSFGIHPQTLRPGCINRPNHLLPPTPCSGDRCSPTSTASYSEGYIKELFQAHKAHKGQRHAG